MDLVKKTGKEIIITKHKTLIAKLCPIKKDKRKLLGWMKGTAHIQGDIIGPIGEEWDADR